ncbi:hypothetical protein ACOMHN_019125 [Nucella lapillus]
MPYTRDLGASPIVAGVVESVYGALQLFSSPVLGRWSDHKGRHSSLSVCLLLAGAGYLSMGLATSIPLLVLSRIPLGIFKHSQSLSRTYLADLVPEKQRSTVLGRFNAASSVGFIVGPIVGGHVAEWPGGFQHAAFLGGGVFCLNTVLVWFLLPHVTKFHNQAQVLLQRDKSTLSFKTLASEEISFNPKNFFQSFRDVDWQDLWDLFLIKFLAGFSVLLFRSNFTVVLKQKYDASPKTRGYMMSYTGMVSTLCGFGVGRFTQSYSSQSNICLHMLVLQFLSLFCLTAAPSIGFLFAFLAPLSFVTCTQRVVGTDLTMRRGSLQERGKLMGLSHSIMSVARMMAPFFAGVTQEVHVDGASVVAMVTTACAAVLVYFRPQDPELRRRHKVE